MSSKWFIYVSNGSISVGGVGSLIVRMYQSAKKKGYNLVYFTPFNGSLAEMWLKSFNELNVKIISPPINKKISIDSYFREMLAPIFSPGDSIIFLTFYPLARTIVDYFSDKYLNNLKYNCISYVLHPFNLIIAPYNKMLKYSPIKYINKHLFIRPRTDSIIFMDEESRDTTLNYYSLKNDFPEIIRLGLDWDVYPFETVSEKLKSDTINILSICRMEFPFKGYVLGLVSDFVKLLQKYNNIRLTIVGDGANFSKLKEVVSEYGGEISNKITLVGNVPYSDLIKYFSTAYVYVGMGTTLLDAAKAGVPGITAVGYQLTNYSYGYYWENISKLGGIFDENNKYLTFYELIERIILLSKADYIYLSRLTYDSVKEEYDIEKVMPKFLSMETINVDKKVAYLSMLSQLLINIVTKIYKKIYHKI